MSARIFLGIVSVAIVVIILAIRYELMREKP
jgi:hypothetical protein